jgi:hypothetical protein
MHREIHPKRRALQLSLDRELCDYSLEDFHSPLGRRGLLLHAERLGQTEYGRYLAQLADCL